MKICSLTKPSTKPTFAAGAQSATGGTGNRLGKLSGKYSIIYRGKPLVNEKPLY